MLVLSGRCLPFPGETFPTISLSGITLKVSGSLSSNLRHKLVWLQLLSPVLCWDAGGGAGLAPCPSTSSDNPNSRLLKWLLQPSRFALCACVTLGFTPSLNARKEPALDSQVCCPLDLQTSHGGRRRWQRTQGSQFSAICCLFFGMVFRRVATRRHC